MKKMFNEYDNVRNPMLGAYLLWSFVLGYFSEKNEATPLEELFIVLPMTLKEDIAEQIKSTNKTSGMRAMSDKFMKTDVLKNDLISNLHNDIQNMKDITAMSLAEAVKAGLVSIDVETNKIFPLELRKRNKESANVLRMGKNAEKLGQWCAVMDLMQIEEILKVRFQYAISNRKTYIVAKNQKYSHKDIELNTNSVNVITGDSRTGKSAIIPIIDYCLASGECYIPTQTIRNACSWFGVVIKLEKNIVLLARREPGVQKSTSDMMFIQGEEIEIPEIPEKTQIVRR